MPIPPNMSMVLTDKEMDFINQHFDGAKSAAVHKALQELMHTYQVDWQQATRILADRSSTDTERHQAAERIQIELGREGDNGLWDWILEGDWTGKETLQSVKDELAEVEE